MDDDLDLNPLAGYATATLPQNAVMLKLDYLSPPPGTSATASLRLAMTRAQASELGAALRNAAGAPHIPRPKGTA